MCKSTEQHNSQILAPCVVLVDPFSSGVMLQERLFAAGYQIILAWSHRSSPRNRNTHVKKSPRGEAGFAGIVVHKEGKIAQTVDKILQVPNVEIVAVMNGSEVGVLLEDALAIELNARLGTTHLRSSGVQDVQIKVDKFMQAEACRLAGLKIAAQKCAKTADDVRSFLESMDLTEPFQMVVKPQTGAGSVGVTFCHSVEEVWQAFDNIMTGQHAAHFSGNKQHCSVGVLLMEYLKGTEYIVNMVVRDGVPKTTAVWKYDKRPYNGAPFVCYSKELQSPSDDHVTELIEYTENVLAAFNYRNGAVHAEIMYTKDGPKLVEINCRLHGGSGAWVRPAEQCVGYSQLSLYMDVYLNGGQNQFDVIPARPEIVQGGSHQVKMRSHVQGTLKDIKKSHVDRIVSLKSYQEHFFSVRPGGKVKRTVDMPSVPGEVTLVHDDKEQLAADYAELNDILHDGVFVVEGGPAPSALTEAATVEPALLIPAPAQG